MKSKPYRDTKANAELITALVNHATQIAEALEAQENMQAEFPQLMEECRKYWKTGEGIDALRAAKEAGRGPNPYSTAATTSTATSVPCIPWTRRQPSAGGAGRPGRRGTVWPTATAATPPA